MQSDVKAYVPPAEAVEEMYEQLAEDMPSLHPTMASTEMSPKHRSGRNRVNGHRTDDQRLLDLLLQLDSMFDGINIGMFLPDYKKRTA